MKEVIIYLFDGFMDRSLVKFLRGFMITLVKNQRMTTALSWPKVFVVHYHQSYQ